jgi:hypothetical protein
LWDRTVDQYYLTYGLGFDWKFTDTLQWTLEAFGQAAEIFSSISSTATISPARTPIGSPSARRFAFPRPKRKPARERTGHL